MIAGGAIFDARATNLATDTYGTPSGAFVTFCDDRQMYQIGTVATFEEAHRLATYLAIAMRLERRRNRWMISVCNENHVSWAMQELNAFNANPFHPRFPPPLFARNWSALERQIVEMHHQGSSLGQIAQSLGVYERKVRRALHRYFEHRQLAMQGVDLSRSD